MGALSAKSMEGKAEESRTFTMESTSAKRALDSNAPEESRTSKRFKVSTTDREPMLPSTYETVARNVTLILSSQSKSSLQAQEDISPYVNIRLLDQVNDLGPC